MTDILNKVVTAAEAAEMLNITQRQVQRLCAADKLINRHAKGAYLITLESVEGYKKQPS